MSNLDITFCSNEVKDEKILKITILMIISLFILTGCESTYYLNNEEITENQTDRFIIIKEWFDDNGYRNRIAYDKETLVEYWVMYSSYMSGVTVLLDAEGKPILYNGE